MSKLNVTDDNKLKNYWAFVNKNSGGYVHRSHQADFYYCVSLKDKKPRDTETFLLMPAGEDDRYTWYFVFIADEEANPCWTIGNDNKNKLQDQQFVGDDTQRFAFIPVDNQWCNILCKASGMYLYRSKTLMDAHQPIRQSDHPAGDDRYQFRFDRLAAVNIPKITAPDREPGQLDDPPKPQHYGDLPQPPERVLVGETLLPFFNVPQDPTIIGDNPINWQIKNRPYYAYNRYQQWKYGRNGLINQGGPATQTYSVKYAEGIVHDWGTQAQKKTSFTIGLDLGTKATLGVDGMSAEASRGFKFGWQKDLTVTVSENLNIWSLREYTYELKFDNAPEGVTYVDWQIYDIWEVVYDSKNSDSWPVGTLLRRPEWFPNAAVPVKVQ